MVAAVAAEGDLTPGRLTGFPGIRLVGWPDRMWHAASCYQLKIE